MNINIDKINTNKVNKISSKKNKPESTTIFTPLLNALGYLHGHIHYLNNSKFFAGIVMILLNVGSKFITINFSKSTEEYLKLTISKQILVFAMAWMGTRDIITALGLTAAFTILSDYIFNEESNLCIVPEKHRVLKRLLDTNNDGQVSETELNAAISVLEKSKKEKQRKQQKESFAKFDFEKYNYDK
jgi:hypothetical protein